MPEDARALRSSLEKLAEQLRLKAEAGPGVRHGLIYCQSSLPPVGELRTSDGTATSLGCPLLELMTGASPRGYTLEYRLHEFHPIDKRVGSVNRKREKGRGGDSPPGSTFSTVSLNLTRTADG